MTPSLEEALRQILSARDVGLHVAIPGNVVTYHAVDGTVDVQPGVRRPYPSEDGSGLVYDTLPILPSVPVMWPGSSAGWLTWPLSVGDSVLVVACDYDPAAWVSGGGITDPEDARPHSLAHGFAIPFRRGAVASTGKLEMEAVTIALGNAASSYVALADKVADALTSLRAWANTHNHAGPSTVPNPPLLWPTGVPSTAAAKVKAQ